ncbi:hypothetical protein AB0A95_34670, partial [Micromonospora sp. NPDC049230]|uniref:hypothetical protein n=1 Tax=Micromonospora sp. NPDC049230 TaxID=3155502 RepID=UPI0033F0E1FE
TMREDTMTITVERTLFRPISDTDDMALTCEHRGCRSGEPSNPTELVPGGPLRPPSWGGAGAGPAKLTGTCPQGLEFCCGECCGE